MAGHLPELAIAGIVGILGLMAVFLKWPRLGCFLTALVIIGGGGSAAAFGFLTPAGRQLGMELGPKCFLGLSGHNVNLTVQGWYPRAGCDRFSHSTATTQTDYPTGDPIVCAYDMAGMRWIVRDSGVTNIDLYGRVWCKGLYDYGTSHLQDGFIPTGMPAGVTCFQHVLGVPVYTNGRPTPCAAAASSPALAPGVITPPLPAPASPPAVPIASNRVLEAAAESCTWGVQGTNVSVTLDGPNACQQPGAGANLFRLAGEPTNRIVCQGTHEGLTFRVRDTGLHIQGNKVCKSMGA